ncbi:hypothetical protein ACSBR2_036465 [Camellia fascicularis]
MALPLGKLTILIGAGIVGSVLAKEGRFSTVSDFCSGAFKIVLKQIRHDDSTPSSPKPRNDSLMSQVNSLRQELQLLASNRPITIVTSSGSGSSKYGIIVIVIVVASGYVWWKGWKLPDMMFATKRSLSDACNTIAKQLENVYSSIAATKRHLSSKIDRVDRTLEESAELTAATREEVSELRGEIQVIGVDVQSVHHVVRTLDLTNEGVRRLVDYTRNLEIQAAPSSSSRPALEMPQILPPARVNFLSSPCYTGSLPPIPPVEPPSPSNGSRNTSPSNGSRKELQGISEIVEALSSPGISNGLNVTEDTNNNGILNSGLFGRRISGISASFLTRTRSAVQSFK